MGMIEHKQPSSGYGRIASPLTLRQAVVEQLRNAIVSGAVPPGSLLRETALARELGVSATPVREAFGELSAEGLVEIEAHRLKRATPIDFDAMHDLIQVQVELWRLGYVWGMPHVHVAEIAQLDAAVDAYRNGLEADDPLATIRAGHAFHTVVITASANRELLRSTLDRRSLIARFVLLHGRETVTARGLEEHEAILRAFRKGDRQDALARLDRVSRRLLALTSPDGACAAASGSRN